MHPRAEIGRERKRQIQVRMALEGALIALAPEYHAFFKACATYLIFSMDRLHHQDQWICDLLKERVPKDDPVRRHLSDLDARQEMSRNKTARFKHALGKYEADASQEDFVPAALEFCAMFKTALLPRKNPFEPYTSKLFKDEDWITIAGVTQESLKREADLFSEVKRLAPPDLDPDGFEARHMN